MARFEDRYAGPPQVQGRDSVAPGEQIPEGQPLQAPQAQSGEQMRDSEPPQAQGRESVSPAEHSPSLRQSLQALHVPPARQVREIVPQRNPHGTFSMSPGVHGPVVSGSETSSGALPSSGASASASVTTGGVQTQSSPWHSP
jgi:hypothetical protein